MSDTPLTLMQCLDCGMTAKCLLSYPIRGRHGPGLACSSHDWVAVTQADDNGHTEQCCSIATTTQDSPDVAVSQHADAAVGQVLRLAEHLNRDNEELARQDAERLEDQA
jgi:hypothetical protein